MGKLQNKTVPELLALHASVMEELREREVLRSENPPTGDLAEYLFCKAYGWCRRGNSAEAYDAIDSNGRRYQIKGSRVHRHIKNRRPLFQIRNPDGFDVFAVVTLGWDYSVMRAALMPADIVRHHSAFNAHTNSHLFRLRDDIWDASGVIDATGRLCATENAL